MSLYALRRRRKDCDLRRLSEEWRQRQFYTVIRGMGYRGQKIWIVASRDLVIACGALGCIDGVNRKGVHIGKRVKRFWITLAAAFAIARGETRAERAEPL